MRRIRVLYLLLKSVGKFWQEDVLAAIGARYDIAISTFLPTTLSHFWLTVNSQFISASKTRLQDEWQTSMP